MRFLFIMDPPERMNIKKDTTHLLMQGAQRRGHEVYYVAPHWVGLDNGKLDFRAQRVEPLDDPARPVRVLGEARFSGDQVDAVFLRTDPPFDDKYLLCTWLLDFMPDEKVVINRPSSVRDCNEKIWAARFPDLCPETRITAQIDDVQEMLDRHRRVILKPTDQFAGRGIFLFSQDDSNMSAAFDLLTDHGSTQVIAQQFVPQASEGDRRVLLLEGKPLGVVLRKAAEGEHRNNLAAGGSANPAELSDADRAIAARLEPELVRRGLDFVGIDILGDRLIEVNVTSPTCLRELSHFVGRPLEEEVIALAERRLARA